ncbi:MAG: FAD-dependent oxidoreductase [Deltaproteobacteria bacterium]|nr:FAD-dependent oxidoreductase [Deltaproteobacteria bacterium]
MFNHLFAPLRLRSLSLSNRICFMAHRTNFGQRGRLTDRHIAYYRRRAKGGCGLIILGELALHPNDRPWETLIQTYHPQAPQDLQKITQSIHEFETALFAQLTHHGFQSSGALTRREVWGPSAVSDIVFGETAKAMESEDLDEITGAFSKAAIVVREAGFDGLEIDLGPESLLRQFLSPLSNHRQDDYGGSLENRMRLPLEVIQAVRKSVGGDFPLGVRLCLDERFWSGITLQESLEVATRLEDSGHVDFIQTTWGTYYNLYLAPASMHTSMDFILDQSQQLKSRVSLPVFVGSQIEFPSQAETVLDEGKADAIGFVRALVCDPDLAAKAKAGHLEDIRHCVKDNQGCIGRINQSKALGCILNPQVGYEPLAGNDLPVPARKTKKIMIIGAGPAGMKAALTARERGHEVTLYERGQEAGGQINLARLGAGRGLLDEVTRHLKHMVEKNGILIRTGVEVTPEFVRNLSPDAVVVATGSRPDSKPFPGTYGPPTVLTVWDVLSVTYPVGNGVLYVDETGGHRAAATAERLADQGKKVDMVTSELFVGLELAALGDLYLTRQRLLQKGVTFITDVVIDAIQGTWIEAHDLYTNRPLTYCAYDTIVLDVPQRADENLYLQLKGQIKELFRIGDCLAPRTIEMAIFEGAKIGGIL